MPSRMHTPKKHKIFEKPKPHICGQLNFFKLAEKNDIQLALNMELDDSPGNNLTQVKIGVNTGKVKERKAISVI